MQKQPRSSFFSGTAFRVVTLALLLQAAAFYGFSRTEYEPNIAPLSTFPSTVGSFRVIEDIPVEQEVREILKADDILNRNFVAPDGRPVNLFIAAFRSQRTGKAPHSPRNCLPGSGWTQLASGVTLVDVPGFGQIEANRYLVANLSSQSLVLYWYQSRNRSIASEYTAKLYTILDSVRYNRSDTALVRVVVPIAGRDQESADKTAVEFVRAAFPEVRSVLPQ